MIPRAMLSNCFIQLPNADKIKTSAIVTAVISRDLHERHHWAVIKREETMTHENRITRYGSFAVNAMTGCLAVLLIVGGIF